MLLAPCAIEAQSGGLKPTLRGLTIGLLPNSRKAKRGLIDRLLLEVKANRMTIQRFYYSRLKLGGMTFALTVILVAPGVLCILNDSYSTRLDRVYLAAVSSVFFLLAALVVRKFYRVCVEHKPIVTITDAGIVDTRVSRDMIAWDDVKSVQFSGSRDRTIHLQLIPGARKRLRLKRLARVYAACLGAVGIASGPLAVRDSALLRAIEIQIERRRAAAGVAEPR
jgi:hypothetical protein